VQIDESARQAYDPARHPSAGGSITDVLGDAGPPVTVTDPAGKVWTVGFPTQRAKARYEQLVLDREKKIVLAQKAILPPDDYERRVDKLAEQVNERAFVTGKPLWLKHATTPVGWLVWVQSLLAEHHPDVTFEQTRELLGTTADDVRLALGLVVPSFFAWAFGMVEEMAERTGDDKILDQMRKVKAQLPAILDQLTRL
jgi:hypothetical protein